MSFLEKFAVGALIMVGLLGLASYKAYQVGHASGYAKAEKLYKAEIEKIEAEHDKEIKRLTEEGRRLNALVKEAEKNINVKYVETVRYVYKNARAGHASIDAALTRMLNNLTGIRENPPPAPAAPGRDGADREAPADSSRPGATSERALSEWIAEAVTSHEKCRVRHNALIEWAKACSGGSE